MEKAVVVKLGGSAVAPLDLARWVDSLERSVRPLVVVPGGGPFARFVRGHQARLGFDDAAAYRMSVLAMEQYGHALVSLARRFVPAATTDEMEAATLRGLVPVWMPAEMVLRHGDFEEVPNVGSDSLAAWLAGRIAGSTLCVVKQIDLPHGSTIEAATAAGIVDPAFPATLHPATRLHMAGPADLSAAGRRLANGVVPGRETTRRSALVAEAAQ